MCVCVCASTREGKYSPFTNRQRAYIFDYQLWAIARSTETTCSPYSSEKKTHDNLSHMPTRCLACHIRENTYACEYPHFPVLEVAYSYSYFICMAFIPFWLGDDLQPLPLNQAWSIRSQCLRLGLKPQRVRIINELFMDSPSAPECVNGVGKSVEHIARPIKRKLKFS